MPSSEKEDYHGNNEDRAPDEYEVGTFRQAMEDARRTHDEQLQAYSDIDDRNWRVLQFNGLIATIAIAGAVNVGENISPAAISLFFLGIALLTYSTYRLLHKTPVTEVTLGPSDNDLGKISEKNPAEGVYLDWMIGLYSEWTKSVENATRENSANVDLAKLLSVVGTGLMISGGLIHVTIRLT